MEYKEQKFEDALKPHKCQIQMTKKITARPYINDSPNYTESLICLNCNLKYLFIIKVRIRDIKIQSKQLWRKKETQILTYTNALKKFYMDYKQQKFEDAFETPQMPNGKYQKKAKKRNYSKNSNK